MNTLRIYLLITYDNNNLRKGAQFELNMNWWVEKRTIQKLVLLHMHIYDAEVLRSIYPNPNPNPDHNPNLKK